MLLVVVLLELLEVVVLVAGVLMLGLVAVLCAYIYICIDMCMRVCMYKCMYVCMYE